MNYPTLSIFRSILRSLNSADDSQSKDGIELPQVGGVIISCALLISICAIASVIAPTAHAQSASAVDRLKNAGVATASELEEMERRHTAELQRVNKLAEDLEYKIELLERRLSRIEKARQLEERHAEEASFEKSRMLNWPKTTSGMNRREIYRLIGSGVKDRTDATRDCRCYSQGKICFNDEDLAKKSNVRCQL